MAIKFGTDGWRGIIAQDFTFDNVRACAQGVAYYLKQAGLAERGLLIGYDTRFASEHFASAAAEVVAGNGIKVYLCSAPTPTPVISYGVLAQKAGGAIIITASHNPPIWNGFKYKTEDGASAPTEVVTQLEKNIARSLSRNEVYGISLAVAEEQGRVEYLDLAPIYSAHVKKLIDLDRLRKAKLKVVVDSMYGAGVGYLKRLLDGGSMKVTEINGERNPLFPGMGRPEPILPHLKMLSALVRRSQADIGLATDGDADRLGVVDDKGEVLTPQQVFALLALYLLEVRRQRGAIVKTVASKPTRRRIQRFWRNANVVTCPGTTSWLTSW